MTKPSATVKERLGWRFTPELYETIRRLWINHSIAEDARDIQGLLDTLAEDCIYEIPATRERWEGHEGARQFYTAFLKAFPDVKFELKDIVIGPQGVFEVARMTGTQMGVWSGIEPSAKRVELTVIIYFPWNPAVGKFAGETIYFERTALGRPINQ